MADVTDKPIEAEAAGNPYADGCAWLDDSYLPIADAKIPITDSGFNRSDLTYDVVGVWGGKFFRLDDHLDRFEGACRKLRISTGVSREQIREILIECVARSGLRESYVEIFATRGLAKLPGDRDIRNTVNRICAYAIPYQWIEQPDAQEVGTDIVVARDTVRVSPGSTDPTIKNFQWGDFNRALFEAYDRGARLPVLTDGAGNVTEGPGFNVCAVSGNELLTAGRGVLQGITRRTALEIGEEMGLEVKVDFLPVGRFYGADEIFLCSTAGGIMPVANLDGSPVGSTQPGPITAQIRKTYWDWHLDPRFTEDVDYAAAGR